MKILVKVFSTARSIWGVHCDNGGLTVNCHSSSWRFLTRSEWDGCGVTIRSQDFFGLGFRLNINCCFMASWCYNGCSLRVWASIIMMAGFNKCRSVTTRGYCSDVVISGEGFWFKNVRWAGCVYNHCLTVITDGVSWCGCLGIRDRDDGWNMAWRWMVRWRRSGAWMRRSWYKDRGWMMNSCGYCSMMDCRDTSSMVDSWDCCGMMDSRDRRGINCTMF